ncbi:MAG: hypothetical protein CSA25_02995 [Desulfobacter postgatei]|uniref:Uncharacterized protein n=1 Tax=Desulfobacter postgatei TaxID=2293 RepID=A0A2G6MSE0_9BACT|nr:MAG: hypothetical protein CSA25_02995 [Desulfobacter postgatei]
MGVSEKVMEALRAGILLNDKVSTLMDTVERMDQDMRGLDKRIVRIETLIEVSQYTLQISHRNSGDA